MPSRRLCLGLADTGLPPQTGIGNVSVLMFLSAATELLCNLPLLLGPPEPTHWHPLCLLVLATIGSCCDGMPHATYVW